VVSSTGIYHDTLRYANTGCDSARRTVNLTVQNWTTSMINPIICSGQTYTLPWGAVVSAAGTYHDTLRYVSTGCDSVRITVNLTIQNWITSTINPIICTGQTYTLPWGAVVTVAGTYRDTLRYVSTGCDSVRRTVNLTVQNWTTSTINPIICSGQTYTLPWGAVVNSAGTYHDTLRYANTGCDSVRRAVNLTVQNWTTSTINPIICSGQTYTLPWGAVVTAAGTYHDTLRYVSTGCDSVRRTVNLTIQNWITSAINPIICTGQTYTLPWGAVVSSTGTYRDTLRYVNTGCDSVRRVVNLTVQSAITQPVQNQVICNGQTFTLPWGQVVSSAGIYRDTLRYINTGCDSIRRSVNLIVQSAQTFIQNRTICQGQTYTLPWGQVVSSSGTYRDTLHFTVTNCDSLYRIVNLSVTPAAVSGITASVCSGDTYTLPWGTVVSTAGIYRDTTRTAIGCDSLIRSVTLTVMPKPTVTISKSNDIDCMVGTSKLNATGGVNYLWQPGSSLSNAAISNPVATPTATTMYRVRVTSSNGCFKDDSIQVKVIPGAAANGFLLPTAFTPNGDGKNDCFGLRTWGNVTNVRFEIYNRWGEIVFRTSDPSQCWDGTYKGERQSTAVFVYQVWADTFCGPVYRKGTVTLVR
jgi:gliding motility-associated-like protein